jgi:DNA-directed RNA polymerase specialized sigma24 family protein
MEQDNKTHIKEAVQTQERSRIPHLCMGQLNPDYREALSLIYFENMRHAEAAAVIRKM